MKKTLAWQGQSDIPLKECASQTRERWTLNTHVRSVSPTPGDWPPLEILFKGGAGVSAKVERTLQALCAGGDYGPLAWLSVAVGPKGSYRQEHVLRYLQRHLLPMDSSRRWRILMCDVYSAHLNDEVRVEALKYGYVLVHHGGGCAGVLQFNDTHLHHKLSASYQELEQHDLMERSRLQPAACARRDREDCMRDAIAAWQNKTLHELATRGHWDNMLCNALDGSEDARARGEAARLWESLQMSDKRSVAIAEVEQSYAAGQIS